MGNCVALQHREFVLGHLREGHMLAEIALALGVTKQAISKALADDPEYKDALCDQADALIYESKTLTWSAREMVDIARAREITKWAFRYAESINAPKWSPKQSVTHNVAGNVSVDMGFAGDILQARRVFTELPAPTHALDAPDTPGDGEGGPGGGHAE